MSIMCLARDLTLKVRVVARLLRRDAAGRVIDEHHLQQFESSMVEIGRERLTEVSFPLRKRRLEVWIRRHARPHLFRRGAENPRSPKLASKCLSSFSASGCARKFNALTGKS